MQRYHFRRYGEEAMIRYLSILLMLVATTASGDFLTNSRFGIDSTITELDGTGLQIGQAEGSPLGAFEGGRSGKAGYDDPDKSASNQFRKRTS